MGYKDLLVRQKGSTIASINLLIAALLVLGAAGWPYIQKGFHWYYQREANAFFLEIEKTEISYKNVNSRYLPFNMKNSTQALKTLNLRPERAKYYDFSVEELDRQSFRITARLKPDMIKKWYLHHPKSRFHLIYEKRDGEKGRRVK